MLSAGCLRRLEQGWLQIVDLVPRRSIFGPQVTGEEGFDRVEHSGAVLGLEDGLAQGGSARDAVGKPAGELLHLAHAVALAFGASDLPRRDDVGRTRGFGAFLD